MNRSKWQEPSEDAARIIAAFSLGQEEGRERGKDDAQFAHNHSDDECRKAKRAEERERARWQKSLGHESPEAAWVAINKSRADERAKALEDARVAIRANCGPCGGSGISGEDARGDAIECEYCGRPIAAIKALPGAPA